MTLINIAFFMCLGISLIVALLNIRSSFSPAQQVGRYVYVADERFKHLRHVMILVEKIIDLSIKCLNGISHVIIYVEKIIYVFIRPLIL